MLLGISGLCAAVNISPLLSCMVFGAAYINLTEDKKLFRQINNFTPPIMSIFFIVSGMNLDLRALETVGIIGISYFAVRIVGKYAGTYVGCLLTGSSREMRNYMGLALIPQAGVAIGLAFLGQRLLPTETGNLMLAIILSSSVLYEMIGPISAKLALVFSGSIPFGHTELPEAESREREEKEMLLCPEEGESRGSQSREPQDTNRSIEELMEEMSAGVDERDDDDIEKSVIGESEKEENKSKDKKESFITRQPCHILTGLLTFFFKRVK